MQSKLHKFLSGPSRRRFFHMSAITTLVSLPSVQAAEVDENVFGPLPGYSPQIGILVSEMNWMRGAVLRATRGMTQEQLDFLLDARANRTGALILHLAAAEKLYQLNTFDNLGTGDLAKSAAFKDWGIAMDLGDPAREAIKGHKLDYYLDSLHTVREKTLTEFRKRDDAWLMAVDKTWVWGPTNNLCKWFHVCEHESHHTGQISLIKSRIPGVKPENA